MKSAIPILAGLALALAPAAHAQVSCSEISSVTGYSKDEFDDIIGEEVDDDYYKATYSISGATECTLDFGWDSVYQCIWVYNSQSAASAAYHAQRGAVAACLPGWTADPMTPSATATDGYRTLEGVFYAGAGSNVDLEWGVFLEEHTSTNGTDWHVAVGLAYLW
jgi:hypothetical protein